MKAEANVQDCPFRYSHFIFALFEFMLIYWKIIFPYTYKLHTTAKKQKFGLDTFVCYGKFNIKHFHEQNHNPIPNPHIILNLKKSITTPTLTLIPWRNSDRSNCYFFLSHKVCTRSLTLNRKITKVETTQPPNPEHGSTPTVFSRAMHRKRTFAIRIFRKFLYTVTPSHNKLFVSANKKK